jgi:hypothetical protein
MKRIIAIVLALVASTAMGATIPVHSPSSTTAFLGANASTPSSYVYNLNVGDTSAGAALTAGRTYGYQWQVGAGDTNGFDLMLTQLNQGGGTVKLLDFARNGSSVSIGDSTSGGGQNQLCVLGSKTSCSGSGAESMTLQTATFGGNFYGLIINNTRASTQSTADYFIRFSDQTSVRGSIAPASTTTVAYNTTSDQRLKTAIKPMADGLATVRRMQPVDFHWKQDGHADKGFIAQDLAKVYPFVVTGNENGDPKTDPMMVDYGRVTPVLAAAIQDLDRENQDLKAKLAKLEKRLADAGL